MEAVYYYDKNKKCCPVKNYLVKYQVLTNDSQKEKDFKKGILSNIDSKIRYIVSCQGSVTAVFISKLKGYSFFEIKERKNKNIVIRIFYFRYSDKIILLNALEKPDNYHTNKKRKEIDTELKITESYKNNFEINPKLYEKYK